MGEQARSSRGARPPFVRHTGIAAPYMRRDVEVEFIAPLGPDLHILHTGHTGPGMPEITPHTHDENTSPVGHAFEGFRYRTDGSENPDFILNREPYREASILLAGENFGIGTVQGFAVVRLLACGFRVVIAPSFGPVFHDDCFDYGLLPVTLPPRTVEGFAERATSRPRVPMTVDLERQVVERADMDPVPFGIDARLRNRLLLGSDEMELEERLEHSDAARRMRDADRRRRPWLYDDDPP